MSGSEMSLAGRTAVVTGASSGIGLAIAKRLASAGAYVFLAGRTFGPMEQAKLAIEEAGGDAQVVTADLRDPDEVQSLVDVAVERTGRLDIMVNNAGLEFPSSIIEGSPEDWRAMLETNVLALLAGCKAAVLAMRKCGAQGHIVNMSSVSAQRRNSGVYGATKHAVNVISASLRDELEEDDIRVTNVLPGATATNFARHFPAPFVDKIIEMSGTELTPKEGDHYSAETLDGLARNLSKNLCSPDDIASAVMYAVTQPITVNIADIVVRPPRAMTIPH
jgi:NADP-dependent 3-hydroxy acid dehydrogenase YdfG